MTSSSPANVCISSHAVSVSAGALGVPTFTRASVSRILRWSPVCVVMVSSFHIWFGLGNPDHIWLELAAKLVGNSRLRIRPDVSDQLKSAPVEYAFLGQVLLHPAPMRGLRPGYVGIPLGSLARFLNQCSRRGVLLGLRPLRTEALGRPLLGEFPAVQGHGPWSKPMNMPRATGTPIVVSHREPLRHLCGIQHPQSRRATQWKVHISAQRLAFSWSVASHLLSVRAVSVRGVELRSRGLTPVTSWPELRANSECSSQLKVAT